MTLAGSSAGPRQAAEPPLPDPPTACEQCAIPMEPDQEWCVNCGAARTLIHPPPDVRVLAGVAGGVALGALVLLVVLLVNLSNGAGATAAGALVPTVTVTTQAPAAASPAPASPAPASPGASAAPTTPSVPTRSPPRVAPGPAGGTVASTFDGFPGWPIGLSGWTVVLASEPTRVLARDLGRQLESRALVVGLLSSDQHPFMHPGHWIVFSGRYPTYASAHQGSLALHARGFDTARPAEVAASGG